VREILATVKPLAAEYWGFFAYPCEKVQSRLKPGRTMKKQDIYRSAITDESGEPLGDVEHFSFDVISQTKGPVNPYDGSYNVITGSGNTPFAVLDVPDDSRLEFDK